MYLIPVNYHDGNYSEQMDYLLFRHHEETMEKLYDENGNRILRPALYMDGIGCVPSLFPTLAQDLNQKYQKGKKPGRCNMMQYIISYHPDDCKRGGLDVRRAHELSMEWVRRCIAGVIGIAVTHDDGDRHSGNIHTHIILCTVKCSSEIAKTMKHPEHAKVGNLFSPSRKTWMEYREILMEIARREGLYIAYRNELPLDRISSREYRGKLRGQKKLDEENRKIIDAGGIPETIVFRTEKQKYRDAIRDAAERSRNILEFQNLLKNEYGILITEREDQWRYDREGEKGFSGSTLGRRYYKATILEMLEKNRENPNRIAWYLHEKERRENEQDKDRIHNSLQGYRETLAPPYRDDLAGDIGRAVYEQGMAISDPAEQVKFFRPFAETVWWIGNKSMTLDDEIFQRDTFSFHIEDWENEIVKFRKVFQEKENLLSFQKILEDYGHFREELFASDQPQVFRRTHWVELRLLEEAEQVLRKEEPKTLEERREEVKKAWKDLKWAQGWLEYYQQKQAQFRKVESVLAPIRPKLERYHEKRLARQKRERERQEEKHRISLDYER